MYIIIITKEMSPEEIEDNNNNKKTVKQGTIILCASQIQVTYLAACSIQNTAGEGLQILSN